jgi:hypothetical protein
VLFKAEMRLSAMTAKRFFALFLYPSSDLRIERKEFSSAFL